MKYTLDSDCIICDKGHYSLIYIKMLNNTCVVIMYANNIYGQ